MKTAKKNTTTNKRSYKSWTKSELREFLNIWDGSSSEESATKFGVTKSTISSIASNFRKEGYPLQKKRQGGSMRLLIQEIISESKK